jgi:hypothetical protein
MRGAMECPDNSKLPGPIAALFREGGHDQTPEWAAERNNRIVGVALQSGVAGDSIDVLVAPGLKQG